MFLKIINTVIMYAKKTNISISGIVDTDLYCYKSTSGNSGDYGIFTIRLGYSLTSQKSLVENCLSLPIHILAPNLVGCLQEKIQKGRRIMVVGCLHQFKDRLLVSIHNKKGIRLLKTPANATSAENDNLSHAQLVWACNEEDMLMARLAAAEAAGKLRGEGVVMCELIPNANKSFWLGG